MTLTDRNTKHGPIDPPGAARKVGEPPAEREAPSLAWLVLVGVTFGVVLLKESLGRIGGPVVATAKSVPRLPAPFWTALIVGGLERIGARVLGIRIGQSWHGSAPAPRPTAHPEATIAAGPSGWAEPSAPSVDTEADDAVMRVLLDFAANVPASRRFAKLALRLASPELVRLLRARPAR